MAGIANGKRRKEKIEDCAVTFTHQIEALFGFIHVIFFMPFFLFFFFFMAYTKVLNKSMSINHNYIFSEIPHPSYIPSYRRLYILYLPWPLWRLPYCNDSVSWMWPLPLCLKPLQINLKPIYSAAVYLWAMPDSERWAVKKDWAHTAKEHGSGCRKRAVLTTKQMFNGRITGFTLHIFMYFSSTAI